MSKSTGDGWYPNTKLLRKTIPLKSRPFEYTYYQLGSCINEVQIGADTYFYKILGDSTWQVYWPNGKKPGDTIGSIPYFKQDVRSPIGPCYDITSNHVGSSIGNFPAAYNDSLYNTNNGKVEFNQLDLNSMSAHKHPVNIRYKSTPHAIITLSIDYKTTSKYAADYISQFKPFAILPTFFTAAHTMSDTDGFYGEFNIGQYITPSGDNGAVTHTQIQISDPYIFEAEGNYCPALATHPF